MERLKEVSSLNARKVRRFGYKKYQKYRITAQCSKTFRSIVVSL